METSSRVICAKPFGAASGSRGRDRPKRRSGGALARLPGHPRRLHSLRALTAVQARGTLMDLDRANYAIVAEAASTNDAEVLQIEPRSGSVIFSAIRRYLAGLSGSRKRTGSLESHPKAFAASRRR